MWQLMSMRSKVRLIVIAVNILTITPNANVIAKPLTVPEPNTMRITAVIITDVFASKIVENARRKPDSIDMRRVLPSNTSSLKRSKIR